MKVDIFKQNSASGQLVISLLIRDVINNGKKYISSDNEIVWMDSNKEKTITAIDQGIVDGQGSISINV